MITRLPDRYPQRFSWPRLASAAGLALAIAGGCSHRSGAIESGEATVNDMTFAVAPVLNFSGRFDFDPTQAADLLESELSTIPGATVLPVNRVAAYLAAQGKQQIESPGHALEICEGVGADAIWVAGIVEYDAYTPVVGLVVQVYARPGRFMAGQAMDPVEASRAARPVAVKQMANSLLPVGEIQMTYNALHSQVSKAVRRYAEPRQAGDNPLGWRQYLKVQTLFLRFCWHDAIERLLTGRRWKEATSVQRNEMENSV